MKSSPFECGYQPFQLPTDRFFIRFYLIAMLFILFDIEVIFLYPWAVVFKSLGSERIHGDCDFHSGSWGWLYLRLEEGCVPMGVASSLD